MRHRLERRAKLELQLFLYRAIPLEAGLQVSACAECAALARQDLDRQETLLPSGFRLVLEGRDFGLGDARARVERLRILAGDRTVYES